VRDHQSPVDTINGFIEVYLDARGMKGAWEALVFYVNRAKTADIQALAREAQWFEDRMPWDPTYRKPRVQGITANAIDVVIETGDAGPVTAIGINLPNDQTVRERHGSKSVSLSNVNEAYEKSQPPAFRGEFSWTPEEADRGSRWGAFAGELTTNVHEVIGHGSGRIAERLQGNPHAALAEGDYDAARLLFDTYGIHFDPKLRDEVVSRVQKLNLPSYSGFVMPKLEAVRNAAGEITDVTISYQQDLAKQMLEYSAATRGLR
jgi:dipeptidyl-peptidase-3